MKQSIQKANARSLFSRCAKKVTACVLSAALLLACCPLALAAEPDTDPLTAQELTQMTDEQIAALSQEQSDATLNKMAQLFQDGEKQALDEYLSSLGFATTYEEYAEQQGWNEEEIDTEPSIQPMWQSDYDSKEPDKQCHEGITSMGFMFYIGARQYLYNSNTIGYTLQDLVLLYNEAGQPDSDPASIITGFSGHFYNPDTGTNFLGNRSNTALTNAEYYYSTAVKEYKNGNRTAAMTNLSHCLHYTQDAGEPHHASNWTALPYKSSPESGRWNHSRFEARASKVFYMLEPDVTAIDYSFDFYNRYNALPISGLVNSIAVTAKGARDAAISENLGTQQLIAALLLAESIMNTSGFLYKFAKEVRMI